MMASKKKPAAKKSPPKMPMGKGKGKGKMGGDKC